MDTDDARRVAVLHDVVEDGEVTLDELRALGYPEREVMAIDALTKREDEKDDYPQFISRVLLNPLAAKVKLADIEDNLDIKCAFRRTRSPIPAGPDHLFRRDPITHSGRTRSPPTARKWRVRPRRAEGGVGEMKKG